jgi:mono/diheme cytochrome c family protein
MRARLSALALALAACGSDAGGDDDPQELTTWYQHVAPIVASHCMGCHQDGGSAPFSLTSYNGHIRIECLRESRGRWRFPPRAKYGTR